MTITITEILLYAVALTVLVMTPGPVVVATIAKTLASGWRSSLPLAAGVSIVDVLWPLLAILGLSALVQANAEVLQWMRYIGGAILIWMGWRLIVGSRTALDTDPDPSLMRRNAWQGFLAGVLVNLGNPKSIVFFIGILPNLFDIPTLTGLDIAIILVMSAAVPFLGNVVWALAANRARRFLTSARAVRRVNQASGGALAGAGAVIAAT
ncbi:MAG: LysE family translocator [Pseudomonadota bacterium]